MDVAATSSRLTKVARIAALLHRAAPDTQLVTIIVSWLSGELPQRHIGVGWAALRSLPPPAPQPALTVTGVDATLSKIGTLSGKGSQAQRAALVAELFSAATEAEQTFCCDCSAVNCARAQRAGSWPMRSPRPPGSRPRRSNAPRC